jgi:hypothetical protein
MPSEKRQKIGTGQLGLVYLLHFDQPYIYVRQGIEVRVRHYIGWSRSPAMLRRRLAFHQVGQGARLLRAVAQAGITWHVVAIFRKADRHFERWLHSRRDTCHWCPICVGGHRQLRHHRRTLRIQRERANGAAPCAT